MSFETLEVLLVDHIEKQLAEEPQVIEGIPEEMERQNVHNNRQ